MSDWLEEKSKDKQRKDLAAASAHLSAESTEKEYKETVEASWCNMANECGKNIEERLEDVTSKLQNIIDSKKPFWAPKVTLSISKKIGFQDGITASFKSLDKKGLMSVPYNTPIAMWTVRMDAGAGWHPRFLIVTLELREYAVETEWGVDQSHRELIFSHRHIVKINGEEIDEEWLSENIPKVTKLEKREIGTKTNDANKEIPIEVRVYYARWAKGHHGHEDGHAIYISRELKIDDRPGVFDAIESGLAEAYLSLEEDMKRISFTGNPFDTLFVWIGMLLILWSVYLLITGHTIMFLILLSLGLLGFLTSRRAPSEILGRRYQMLTVNNVLFREK